MSTEIRQYEDILYEASDQIAWITLNRPQVLNALRTRSYEELKDAVDRATAAPEVGVIVIQAAGTKAFCSGGDVKGQRAHTPASGRSHLHRLLALGQALRNCGKPVIAAVRGYCIGAGHELQLMCDLTISTETGRFGQTGPNVGMVPVWGATQILPRVVGEKLAREMIFTGRLLSAQEALAVGLINQVVKDEELQSAVTSMCETILDRSPQALRIAKLCLNHAVDAMWPAFTEGVELLCMVYGSPEQQEGARAFLEKRKPDYRQFRKAAEEG